MGVEVPCPGKSVVHPTFSVGVQTVGGSAVSEAAPFRFGPRQALQLSVSLAMTSQLVANANHDAAEIRYRKTFMKYQRNEAKAGM